MILQLKEVVQKCNYFSRAVDESIDISDISQLLIFIRAVDENFILPFAKVSPLYETAEGINIYNNLVAIIDAGGYFKKCTCIKINGARAITGRGIWSGKYSKRLWCALPNISLHHSTKMNMYRTLHCEKYSKHHQGWKQSPETRKI